jgi:hypothetical protein
MLDMANLSAGIKKKLRKEAIRYATTMANISIKNDKYPQFWKNWTCCLSTEIKEQI